MPGTNPLDTSIRQDLTPIDIAPLLLQVKQDIESKTLSPQTALNVASAINTVRQEAIKANTSPSDTEKLYLVKAGELAQFLNYYAKNCDFDESISEKLPNALRQTEDLLILSK